MEEDNADLFHWKFSYKSKMFGFLDKARWFIVIVKCCWVEKFEGKHEA